MLAEENTVARDAAWGRDAWLYDDRKESSGIKLACVKLNRTNV